MLTSCWSDGTTFLLVNSNLLSTENAKNRVSEARVLDKRTTGYKCSLLSMQKGTVAMLELLKQSKKTGIPARYVLFDSWFTALSALHAVTNLGYDVIAMVKKFPKMYFRYNGEDTTLKAIFESNKNHCGHSRYLLSVMIDVCKDDKIIPAKVVYVRNKNKRNDYLCLISTDTSLDADEIIRSYGKRCDIEVFSKCVKVTLIYPKNTDRFPMMR